MTQGLLGLLVKIRQHKKESLTCLANLALAFLSLAKFYDQLLTGQVIQIFIGTFLAPSSIERAFHFCLIPTVSLQLGTFRMKDQESSEFLGRMDRISQMRNSVLSQNQTYICHQNGFL